MGLAGQAERDVTPSKARLVAQVLLEADAPSAVCEDVVDELLEERAFRLPLSKLRRLAERILARYGCSKSVASQAARARAEIGVRIEPHVIEGLSQLIATLPTFEALNLKAAIESEARALLEASTVAANEAPPDPLTLGSAEVTDQGTAQGMSGASSLNGPTTHDDGGLLGHAPELTAGQARAHALLGLALDGVQTNVTLHLHIPFTTGEGETARSGTDCPPRNRAELAAVAVPGVGIIDAATVDSLTKLVGTEFAGVLINQATGIVTQTSTRTYAPTTSIREFVIARDAHCRFPGCYRNGRSCDLDRVEPFDPGGPPNQTRPANLMALCRHHHRAKTFGGWRPTLDPESAEVQWRTPWGRVLTTYPGSLTNVLAV